MLMSSIFGYARAPSTNSKAMEPVIIQWLVQRKSPSQPNLLLFFFRYFTKWARTKYSNASTYT